MPATPAIAQPLNHCIQQAFTLARASRRDSLTLDHLHQGMQ